MGKVNFVIFFFYNLPRFKYENELEGSRTFTGQKCNERGYTVVVYLCWGWGGGICLYNVNVLDVQGCDGIMEH